jgi:hypothetical protein
VSVPIVILKNLAVEGAFVGRKNILLKLQE